ncbi:MAG: peptidoglycan-binding protein [Candidatus Zapsychrus exili]|nr:peptidoglycan-binding protein [Candidatus Zapsychrus exili]
MAEEKEILGGNYGFNPKVEELQKVLKNLGYDAGSIDGKLGFRTRSAVKVFQKEHDLEMSGYLSRKTWEKVKLLYEELFSLKKVTVSQIQKALNNAGFNPGVLDNKLGPKTKKAIRDFQKSEGLLVDGEVGLKTLEKLKEYLSTR